MFCQKLKDESGVAMLIVLIVAFLGSILASSYMGIVISESRQSVWQKRRVQSLFLAEAGLEKSLYYLNNKDDPKNPWVDNQKQLLPTPLRYRGSLAEGYYEISLYSQADRAWLSSDAYLVESTATIPRTGGDDITRSISCIVDKLDGLPVPAALAILDETDPEDEAIKFQSAVWVIDGRDHDTIGNLIAVGNKGLPGIAVANNGDNIPYQLDKFPDKPHRLDQVKGMMDTDGDGTLDYVEGVNAIIEDLNLPKNLDAYANYFRKIAINISGSTLDIPTSLLGSPDQFQILYANLSEGNKKIAGNTTGYGVLVLEGNGEFEMAGNATWHGIIICAGDSHISLKGGGVTPAHINGALMIANGTVEMNGTADLLYCSANVAKVNATLLLYQVYSWCDDWGVPLGSNYNPVTNQGYSSPY